jgi:hypothetical protein
MTCNGWQLTSWSATHQVDYWLDEDVWFAWPHAAGSTHASGWGFGSLATWLKGAA